MNEINSLQLQIEKQTAQIVLNTLCTIDKNCILAGGAPRDWYFNKPATDLDFFVYIPNSISDNTIIDLISNLFVIDEIKNNNAYMPYIKNPNLRFVFQIGGYGVPVQIMVMNFKTDFVLDSFPLSISKIAWKDGVLYPSEDFKLALKYNAIFQTSQGYANNTKYFNKILSKFPDKEFFTSKERMINSSDIFSLI